jgi:ATP-binding cassette subfamily B protein
MRFHGGGGRRFALTTDERPKVTWSLLRRVLRYARPYGGQIAGMLLLILLTTGINLLTPLVLRDLIDRTLPQRDPNRLILLALALLLIPLVQGLINVGQRWLNSRVGEGVIYDLRVALFTHLQSMSLRFFTHTRVGELMSRLNSDVVGAQNAISNTIVGIVTNFIQAAALLTVMLVLEWRLTLLSILILPLFILAARRLGARLRDIARAQLDANAQMNAMMHETLNIGGALLVKLFGRAYVERNRFDGRAVSVRDLGIRRAITGTVFFVIIGLLSSMGMALVYGLGGYLVIQGTFTVGTIVAFGAYLGSLYGALQGLANAPVEFATSIVSFERVFEVLDLPRDIREKPDAHVLREVRGELVFEAVSFKYDAQLSAALSDVRRFGQMDNVAATLSGGQPAPAPAHPASPPAFSAPAQASADGEPGAMTPHSQARETALEDLSFRVAPGQLAALVGPSGAGKTTLTYLIPRLYDPTAGRIFLDGHDLRDVTLESLAAQIGMVTQETYLFHDTIRTNLLYAKLDATQRELEAAAEAANIHRFVQGLPNGYDTVVGERGYRLSGGERQRLALARVILKDPRVLVLDEATSHLDSESEALIQEALKRVMAGRTSIVIAHRLSTILAADLILVLDRGHIVERGTHAELLAQDGLYGRLYDTQFRREAEAAA